MNKKYAIEHQKVEKENMKLSKILQLKQKFLNLKKTTDEVLLELKQLSESQKK